MAKPQTGMSPTQQVDAVLAPLFRNLNSQQAQLGQSQAAQQKALAGYTRDIISYLKGTPAAIGRDYQGAINQQNGFAKQYANQQRLANPNAQIQKDLRAIRAPAEQIAQLSAQNQRAFGGSAANLYALGGAIPNSAFAADKAGALAFARSLPAIEGLRGQQLFQSLLANQAKDSQELASQRAQLESERIAGQQKAQEDSAPDPNYYTDAQGRTVPKGYRFNSRGELQSIGTASSTSGKSKGGFTPLQMSRFRQSAGNIARYTFNGYKDPEDPKKDLPPKSYQEAIQEMLAAGIPLGVAQQQLARYWRQGAPGMKVIRVDGPEKGFIYGPNEVDENGNPVPGLGRPLVPFQKRRKKGRK